MFRRDLRAASYELISPDVTPLNTPKPAYVTTDERTYSQSQLPVRQLGKPRQKYLFDTVDCLAVLLSLICLALAICTISPSLKYAAQLEYTRQIIVLGFLIGIMNQCLQRVIPHTFVLFEAQFGSSSLHNFDGLLRWAPLAERFSLIWRIILILLLLLPLGLGVVYKRFTGGIGVLKVNNGTDYTPTVPYGLDNIGPITAIANATGPFMASSGDRSTPDFTEPHTYGYNIILLSNTSAAAVDGPNQLFVQQLQHDLTPETVFNLTAKVRGTVATYNNTVETHRNDQVFWQKYFGIMYLQSTPLLNPYNATRIGLLNLRSASENTAAHWDASWSFLGLYDGNGTDPADRPAFEKTALGFDVRRHECEVTWTITRNSMELIAGKCDALPLAWQYQYLENCQFFLLGDFFLPILGEYLNPFAGPRNQSLWKLPTFAITTATLFWSRVALQDGFVGIQPGGPLEAYWYKQNDTTMMQGPHGTFLYNETYPVNHTLSKFVPTLYPAPSLYLVVAVQPLITIVAFAVISMMYKTPIGRGFGMMAVLAGVDKGSLGQLSGASFSGQVSKPIGMRVRVKKDDLQDQNSMQRIEYVLGQKGNTGSMKFGVDYH